MAKRHDIRDIFPPEVCDLIDSGVHPTWYAGPMRDPATLTPEFAAESLRKLAEARREAELHDVPNDLNDDVLF